MDKKCTDLHISKIAKFLPKWKPVANLLGLERQIVNDIEGHYYDQEDQCSEALMRWVGRAGAQATYKKLYNVLCEIEENDAAEKVKELAGGPQATPVSMETTSMNAKCSSDVIWEVALLSFDWRTLGRRLISAQRVYDIDREEHDEQNKRERMLSTWLQQEGSKATYRRLVVALERVGNKGTAEKVTKLVMEGKDAQQRRPSPPPLQQFSTEAKSSQPSEPLPAVDDTQESKETSKKLYNEAMKKGHIDCKIVKVFIIGAAGVGKTTIMNRLFNKELPKDRTSTDVMETPVRGSMVRDVSMSYVGVDKKKALFVIQNEEQLMKEVAELIKSHVPTTRPSHGERKMVRDPVHKNTTFSVADDEGASIESEMIDAIQEAKGLSVVSSMTWINFVDSGGQPEFHDLLPIFNHSSSVVLFVLKLSEELNQKPVIEYYEAGKCVGNRQSYLTHKEILEHTLKVFAVQNGKRPTILVIGTYKDMMDGPFDYDTLRRCLECSQLDVISYGSGQPPLAEINCSSPEAGDTVKVDEIRDELLKAAENIDSIQTPLAWFGLELSFKKASKDTNPKGILRLEKCKEIAKNDYSLHGDEFKAALDHFVEHNIFLHYPKVLPDIVFCDPQVIFKMVSEIVKFHYGLKTSTKPRSIEMSKFEKDAFISITILKAILPQFDTKDYILKPELFLKLLSSLNIIADIGNGGYHLMPALLQNNDNLCQKLEPIEGKKGLPLLCIVFPIMDEKSVSNISYCAPSGLFISLVAHLLRAEKWKLCLKQYEPLCCFRNCVTFNFHHKCAIVTITLVDFFSHFAIHACLPIPVSEEIAPDIRAIIHSSIRTVADGLKYPELKIQDAFDCPCPEKSKSHHLAIRSSREFVCTLKTNHTGLIPEIYNIWIKPSSCNQVPPPPTGLKHDNVKTKSMTISWQPPHDVNGIIRGYQVSYTPHGESECLHDVGNTTSTELTNLKPHTEYTMCVRAKTENFGDYSTSITVKTLEDVPPPPIGLKATNAKTRSMTISWQPPHDVNGIIRGYQVSYTPHGESECLYDVVGDTTSIELISLKPNTEYTIHVKAKTVEFGNYSTSITVTTLSHIPPPPTELKVDNVNKCSMTISWQSPHDVNGIITSYEVGYTPHGESECHYEVLGDTTSTELINLKPNTEYTIRVKTKTVESGNYSTSITVTTLYDYMQYLLEKFPSWMKPFLPKGRKMQFILAVVMGLITILYGYSSQLWTFYSTSAGSLSSASVLAGNFILSTLWPVASSFYWIFFSTSAGPPSSATVLAVIDETPQYTQFTNHIVLEKMYTASNMSEDIKEKMKAITIIIQACNENELQASAEEMIQEGGIIQVEYETGIKLYLGKFANRPCGLVLTGKGKRSKHDVKEVLNSCINAKLVIGIGVTAGLGNAKFGDVLIATKIAHFDEGRVQNDGFLSRGETKNVKEIVENVFSKATLGFQWDFQCTKQGRKSKAISGLIASGPYLVDSKLWVDKIAITHAEAKGYEMEGHILQEIADKKKDLDFVIIKGVCDFANGSKSKEWQYTAAKAAASYTKQRLMMSGIYKSSDGMIYQPMPQSQPILQTQPVLPPQSEQPVLPVSKENTEKEKTETAKVAGG